MNYDTLKNEELCALIQKGDKTAEDLLLRKNVRFLQSIINSVCAEYHLRPNPVTNEDFLQEGFIALLCSARNFDISRGIKFTTYAYRHVHGSILDEMKRSFLAEIHKQEDYAILKEACEEIGYELPFEIPHGEILTQEERLVFSMAEALGQFNGGEKMTRKEISKVTGLTLAQVNRRYYSARNKLRESFREYDFWEGIPEDILKQLIAFRDEKLARNAEQFSWSDCPLPVP